jgi:hypothetical protein
MATDEGTMERHEISTEKIDWPELVRHVACERVVVELSELQRMRPIWQEASIALFATPDLPVTSL